MSNVNPSLPAVSMQIEEAQFRAAISEGYLNRVSGVINYLLQNVPIMAVGSFKQAFLTEAQFQAQMGETWILADGRDVTGSTYQTLTTFSTVPDCRGMFLLNKTNGRASVYAETALGTYLPDTVARHFHSTSQSLGNTVTQFGGAAAGVATFQGLPSGAGTVILGITPNLTGGNESRSRNITCNIFVKIN